MRQTVILHPANRRNDSDMQMFRLRSCTVKKAYPTEKIAQQVANWLNRYHVKSGELLKEVYPCRVCNWLHVGKNGFNRRKV